MVMFTKAAGKKIKLMVKENTYILTVPHTMDHGIKINKKDTA